MNRGNPAVKRILADVKELQQHPSSRYHAEPTEDNMFEWHFTIRGPAGSDFEGGIYHGRILLPAEYPFKPPNIVFLTKNGRFETGTKICLSISAYHPEHWQPAWGVRTMLEAIISFLPTEGQGAIGALDWTPRERKKLAKESLDYCCPVCGEVRGLLSEYDEKEEAADPEMAAQISQLHVHGLGSPGEKKPAGGDGEPRPQASPEDGAAGGAEPNELKPEEVALPDVATSDEGAAIAPAAQSQPQPQPAIPPAPAAAPAVAVRRAAAGRDNGPDYVDNILSLALGVLGVVICALVMMKTSSIFDGAVAKDL